MNFYTPLCKISYTFIFFVFDALFSSSHIECDDKGNYFMRAKIERMYCGVSFQKDVKDCQTALEICKENGIEIKYVELSINDYSLKVAK